MASLTLKNVSKIYTGDVHAVSDFNLQIGDKEFVIFVGPSGCGKSTTLRMIAGLEEISAGELYIGERLVNDIQPGQRNISMVFQNYALYPHLTVFENIAFGLKIRKVSKKEITERVTEVANTLSLTHLLERKPKALSGGERQRVALGRAIIRQPEVFLFDEPLSNLDAKLRTQMRKEITKIHNRLGTTFVYVTHDQTEAMTMGDRICVMKDGIIQQVDSPQNIYNMPANMFVAGFIGSPPINLIDVIVRQRENEFYLEFNNLYLKLPAGLISSYISADYIDKTVTIGIRPEHLNISSNETNEESRLPSRGLNAVVDTVEMLGAETYLGITCEGQNLTCRVSAERLIQPGDKVSLSINTRKIHMFDKETQMNIIYRNQEMV